MTESKTYFDELVDLLYIPEKNCSCHIAPPCGDCVEYGGLRDAVENLRAHIERDSADADRYRFARNATDSTGFWIANGSFGAISRWTGEAADRAIDEARAQAAITT